MRYGLASLFVVLSLVGPLPAIDIHVDNVRGDDLRDGGTGRGLGLEAGALRTIGRALQMAHPGDRIVLARNEEPYRESVTLQGRRHCGSELTPLIIDGQGAILDGTLPVPPSAWQFAYKDVVRFAPVYRSTGLLYRDGLPVLRPVSGRRAELQPGQSVLDEGLVWYRLRDGVLPSILDIRWTALTVGITLYDVRDVVIRNLIVQGFALDGVSLYDGATNVELSRVALRGNGRSGLHVGGACRAVLSDSHASDNGRGQIHLEGAGRLKLQQCDLWNEGAPALLREGGTVTGDLPPVGRESRADFVDRPERLH